MSFFLKASELESQGIPFVVVTLLSTRGHAPQDPGAKALFSARGLEAGTVGGGKVEAKALVVAQELLSKTELSPSERVFSVTWNLQHDVGMTCGGEVEFLFEAAAASKWQIVVFGAGHIAQALVPLLLTLDCRVTCIDSRKEWLDRLPAQSARLRKLCSDDMPSLIDTASLPAQAFYTLMTQGHATDLPILKKLLQRFQPAYVGVIGSKVKAIKVRNELKAEGIPTERIEALRCPMGLPLGTNEPAEIAISIAAQLLQERAHVFGETKWD
jgi:xanthine dehydrogenase accessory factor